MMSVVHDTSSYTGRLPAPGLVFAAGQSQMVRSGPDSGRLFESAVAFALSAAAVVVGIVVGVASFARKTVHCSGLRGFASSQVLGERDGFQVVSVDAPSVAAQVIQSQPVGHVAAMNHDPRSAVSKDCSTAAPNLAVSVGSNESGPAQAVPFGGLPVDPSLLSGEYKASIDVYGRWCGHNTHCTSNS